MVELGETPVDETELSLLMIYHDIVGLHVPMHDAIGMTEIQSLEQLEYVISNIVIRQRWIQNLEIGVVDVFKDQGRSFGLRISHNVQQPDDVGSTAQIL